MCSNDEAASASKVASLLGPGPDFTVLSLLLKCYSFTALYCCAVNGSLESKLNRFKGTSTSPRLLVHVLGSLVQVLVLVLASTSAVSVRKIIDDTENPGMVPRVDAKGGC
jgi:amino acid permease